MSIAIIQIEKNHGRISDQSYGQKAVDNHTQFTFLEIGKVLEWADSEGWNQNEEKGKWRNFSTAKLEYVVKTTDDLIDMYYQKMIE